MKRTGRKICRVRLEDDGREMLREAVDGGKGPEERKPAGCAGGGAA